MVERRESRSYSASAPITWQLKLDCRILEKSQKSMVPFGPSLGLLAPLHVHATP